MSTIAQQNIFFGWGRIDSTEAAVCQLIYQTASIKSLKINILYNLNNLNYEKNNKTPVIDNSTFIGII